MKKLRPWLLQSNRLAGYISEIGRERAEVSHPFHEEREMDGAPRFERRQSQDSDWLSHFFSAGSFFAGRTTGK
jgi:hypothetical protein